MEEDAWFRLGLRIYRLNRMRLVFELNSLAAKALSCTKKDLR
jgi:hypothetical protein